MFADRPTCLASRERSETFHENVPLAQVLGDRKIQYVLQEDIDIAESCLDAIAPA